MSVSRMVVESRIMKRKAEESKTRGNMDIRKNLIRERTLINDTKLNKIINNLEEVSGLDGDFAEVGVVNGGISLMIGKSFPDSKVYMYDTWEGLPDSQHQDEILVREQKEFEARKNKRMFSKNDLSGLKKLATPNMIFRKGYFPDTIQEEKDTTFRFVHLDGDLYQTTLDGLSFFYPRMVKGGMITIDDYYGRHTPGVVKAIDYYFRKTKYKNCVVDRQITIIKE